MMKEYLPYLASVLSGLLVFLLGHWISRAERRRNNSSAVEIKEIDDRAKLTEELWEEVRASRVERARLNNELLDERRKNLKLEMVNERLTARVKELEQEATDQKKLGANDGKN